MSNKLEKPEKQEIANTLSGEELSTKVDSAADKEINPTSHNKFAMFFNAWAIASLMLLLSLAFFHLRGMADSTREFINYDDLNYIEPLMQLDISRYWIEWLPNRYTYSFPLRDLTFYLDKNLSQTFGLNIFWISNFIYFIVVMLIFGSIIRKKFSSNRFLMLVGLIILYTHPLHIEVVQWLTCRKYLTAAIPIGIGTYLFERWKNEDIVFSRILTFSGLWLASLACYPTATLWIFWVIGGFYLQHKTKSARKYAVWAISSAMIATIYLKLVGDSTAEVDNSFVNIIHIPDRALTFGINALGRGFLNLIFPVYLSSYYNELSDLNLLGIVLLGMCLGLFLLYYRSVKENASALMYLKKGIFWMCGATLLLIPIANSILSFSHFMLADRHFFLAMPFFIIGGSYVAQSFLVKKKSVGKKLLAFAGVLIVVWTVGSQIIAYQRVPLWRNANLLMDDCQKNENASKCFLASIRENVLEQDCSSIQSMINKASLMYKDIKYSSGFRTEFPFYHSNCIALEQSLSPKEKFEKIQHLSVFYGRTPEIIFALTLTLLEAGNLNGAIEMASRYYMGPLELGPIEASLAIQGFYVGQMRKICEIAKTRSCSESLSRFLSLHPNAVQRPFAISYGNQITEIMAKRGGLIL